MNSGTICTTLVDNRTERTDLAVEHGFSAVIKAGSEKVLFDTGQTGIFIQNAAVLEMRLSDITHVVISHGHYDHAGGLPMVLPMLRQATVHIHPETTGPKSSLGTDGALYNNGVPADFEACIEGITWSKSSTPTEILPGVFLSGEIPEVTEFEICSDHFRTGSKGEFIDKFVDEQALFIVTGNGVTIITGCAHRGIVNTINAAREVSGVEKVNAVIGGMHLSSADDKKIQKTLEELKKLKPLALYPCHCTSAGVVAAMEKEFPDRCFYNYAGRLIAL